MKAVQLDFMIIVPVYNGERYIEKFLFQLPSQFRNNLLFIDDGSTDETQKILANLGSRFIKHESNRGKGEAIQTGLSIAGEKGIENLVFMDVDLQHPPECIEQFLQFSENEIQIGYRVNRKAMPLHRKLSNFLTSLFISIRANAVIKDSQCGFRAYPRLVGESVKINSQGFQYESEFLLKAVLSGKRVVHREIPVVYNDEPSQMNNVSDTLKFMLLWFRSFFWI